MKLWAGEPMRIADVHVKQIHLTGEAPSHHGVLPKEFAKQQLGIRAAQASSSSRRNVHLYSGKPDNVGTSKTRDGSP